MPRPPRPPMTDAERIKQLVTDFDYTEEEAAARVAELRASAEATHEEQRSLLLRARAGDLEARSQILKSVTDTLSSLVLLTGLVKVTSDPPEYHVLLDDPDHPRLRLGGVDALDNQTVFGRRFLETLGWKPHKVKGWDEIVNSLGACITVETPDEATTDAGRGRRWLRTYLHRQLEPTDITTSDTADARLVADNCYPFRSGMGTHIFLPSLRLHIRDVSHGSENPTAIELGKCLTAAGCVRKATHFPKPDGDGTTSLSTWLLPHSLYADPE